MSTFGLIVLKKFKTGIFKRVLEARSVDTVLHPPPCLQN
jgi:hypothetical protein